MPPGIGINPSSALVTPPSTGMFAPLMYRAASWLVRAYAPELMMGMTSTVEEAEDIVVTQPQPKALPASQWFEELQKEQNSAEAMAK